MQSNYLAAAVILAVAGCVGGHAATAQSALAAGRHIVLVGAVKRVEAQPNKVIFTGDDGRDYTLDLARARKEVPTGTSPELSPGTRLYVSGLQSGDRSILVSRLQVLPAALPSVSPTPDVPDVTVRGTVETVDLEHGAFVLRINTHTRIVYVTADTNTSGLPSVAPGRFPVNPGGRVTVGGARQPDGSLLAGLLTAKEDLFYETPADQPNRILIGMVSSPADKLRRRDIKIKLTDGSETKIGVPRGIPIRRAGDQISVYDLSRRDSVRVSGRLLGADFRAYRIDVLAPPPDPDAPPAAADPAPARPGL